MVLLDLFFTSSGLFTQPRAWLGVVTRIIGMKQDASSFNDGVLVPHGVAQQVDRFFP